MAFLVDGFTVINQNGKLQNIRDDAEFMFLSNYTITLPYSTWTPNSTTQPGGNGSPGYFFATIWWLVNSSYYYGCTGMFGHDTGLGSSTAQIRYSGSSAEWVYMIGGGSYGELVYWRYRSTVVGSSTDAGLEFYWAGRRGLNNDLSEVTARVSIYRVRNGHLSQEYTYS